MAYIPGDRQRYGLVLAFPVDDNLVLTDYHDAPFSRYGVLDDARDRRRAAEELIPEFDIRTPSGEGRPSTPCPAATSRRSSSRASSSRDLTLLVADQPTRGLDVGSIEFIHKQIIAKRDAGTAVLLVSAELDEVLELSDRIGGHVPRQARGDRRRHGRRQGTRSA